MSVEQSAGPAPSTPGPTPTSLPTFEVEETGASAGFDVDAADDDAVEAHPAPVGAVEPSAEPSAAPDHEPSSETGPADGDDPEAEARPTVASALSSLEARGWQVVHDLRWPGRPAPIDHVLVGPGGVVVVEVRDEPAELVAPGDQPPGRDRPLVRDLTRTEESAEAVSAQLYSDHRAAVRPVTCLVGEPRPVAQEQALAAVVSGEDLVDLVSYLPRLLGEVDIALITAHLRSLRGSAEPEEPAGASERGSEQAPAKTPEPVAAPEAADEPSSTTTDVATALPPRAAAPAPLPSRRTVRPAGRGRGLFGRRPQS